ncbi:hypothetical protein [Arsenicicoccus bolidensis]|uniref:hypothetical protein n=1 Tax=Arsenicicoccus bolidensis TaxID=229480 RepID=UPI0003FD92B4|nr:hypothetical protein [Arsenicicoccus bolidensis]
MPHLARLDVVALVASAAALGLVACSSTPQGGERSTTPTSISASAATTAGAGGAGGAGGAVEDLETACSRQVTYWVGQQLRRAPDQGFDYQEMGLSGRTYDVVRAVTSAARAARRSDDDWVAQRSRSACREAVARWTSAPAPEGGGWP